MKIGPGILAVRAVNEWRRIDTVAHMGLRLYLDNECALADRWVTDVVVRQVLVANGTSYHEMHQFKALTERGSAEFRHVHVPAPNEALAEAALVHECSKAQRGMRSAGCVYSYRLPSLADERAVFVPYFEGYRERHHAISAACDRHPSGIVLYNDIRRFYPSISGGIAMAAWADSSREAALAGWAQELGYVLLERHSAFGRTRGESVLTGPMFAHHVANLVLRKLDEVMQQALPGGYFRYVDDFVLVGDPSAVRKAESTLNDELRKLDLKPHPDKRMDVSASLWLKGRHDFADGGPSKLWKEFVGSMREMLVREPQCKDELAHKLQDGGFRISPLDYTAVVQEAGWLRKMTNRWRWKTWRAARRRETMTEIVAKGSLLRDQYRAMCEQTLDLLSKAEGYERKRCIHALRHSVGRLTYLEEEGRLAGLSSSLAGVTELELHAAVCDAVASADASKLIHYGFKASQSAARVLGALGKPIRCCCQDWSKEPTLQGRAVLLAHGVPLDEAGSAPPPAHPMSAFCEWADGGASLKGDPSSFFGRLVCCLSNELT